MNFSIIIIGHRLRQRKKILEEIGEYYGELGKKRLVHVQLKLKVLYEILKMVLLKQFMRKVVMKKLVMIILIIILMKMGKGGVLCVQNHFEYVHVM